MEPWEEDPVEGLLAGCVLRFEGGVACLVELPPLGLEAAPPLGLDAEPVLGLAAAPPLGLEAEAPPLGAAPPLLPPPWLIL